MKIIIKTEGPAATGKSLVIDYLHSLLIKDKVFRNFEYTASEHKITFVSGDFTTEQISKAMNSKI